MSSELAGASIQPAVWDGEQDQHPRDRGHIHIRQQRPILNRNGGYDIPQYRTTCHVTKLTSRDDT